MLGVVVEAALHTLADALVEWLPAKEAGNLRPFRKGRATAQLAEEVRKRLEHRRTELPKELGDTVGAFSYLADVIRRTRNDAGHPTGKQLDRRTVLVLLTALPTYLEYAYGLSAWMAENPRQEPA